MVEKLSGVERAYLKAGSNRALVELLKKRGLNPSERSVSYWRKIGYVPDLYAHAFSKATRIPLEDLVRPRRHPASNMLAESDIPD